MEAAVDVFRLKGYSAASIQEVADRVGVLKGSLYYYISSKEDLLARIVDEVHRQSTEILEEVQALPEPAIDRIRIYIERHVEWYLGNLSEVSVFFREWRHLSGDRLDDGGASAIAATTARSAGSSPTPRRPATSTPAWIRSTRRCTSSRRSTRCRTGTAGAGRAPRARSPRSTRT